MSNELDRLIVDLVGQQAALDLHRIRYGHGRKRMDLYFIECGDLVKIGKARFPNDRMKILQTGCPLPLRLIASFTSAGDREGEIHKRLSHLRVQGEWFQYTAEVNAVIKELTNNGN